MTAQHSKTHVAQGKDHLEYDHAEFAKLNRVQHSSAKVSLGWTAQLGKCSAQHRFIELTTAQLTELSTAQLTQLSIVRKLTLGGFMTIAVQIWPFTLEQRLMDATLYMAALTSAGMLMISM